MLSIESDKSRGFCDKVGCVGQIFTWVSWVTWVEIFFEWIIIFRWFAWVNFFYGSRNFCVSDVFCVVVGVRGSFLKKPRLALSLLVLREF